MTLRETTDKINSLKHLVGQNVPRWNSPFLEMIPAPTNKIFADYINIYKKTGNLQKALLKTKAIEFDILLVFSKGSGAFSFICEWYSFFYREQKKSNDKTVAFYDISAA